MKNIITLLALTLTPAVALASDSTDISGTWRDGNNAKFTIDQDESDVTIIFPKSKLSLTGSIEQTGDEFTVDTNGELARDDYTLLFSMTFTGTVDGSSLDVSECNKVMSKKVGLDVQVKREESNCNGTWEKE